MKRLLCLLLVLLAGGCRAAAPEKKPTPASGDTVSLVTLRAPGEDPEESEDEKTPYLRGVWISQFDLQPLFRDGNGQRDREELRSLCLLLKDSLKKDGFNAVFLQLRPNGDSMYESDLFPLSKYAAGKYGGSVSYDAVEVLVTVLRDAGIALHGWINPLRLMKEKYIKDVPDTFAIRRWYDAGTGQVKELDGTLYFDPSYPEVRELIADGAAEICERYGLDGIHMDDYFYPTQDKAFDEAEFLRSGFADQGDFRRDCINRLVMLLYQTAHRYGAVYGIAPAGNLDSLTDGYYADVYRWCGEEGYVDYILPQLYFGFLNRYCPFDVMTKRWADAVKSDSVTLYVGLTAAKAAEAQSGAEDAFAGTEEGKREWIEHKDILARSLSCLYAESRVKGYCFFSYSSLYDLFTGEVADGIAAEYAGFSPLLRR